MVIDCNKEFAVTNQADFNALNGYKESGKVLITPGENNSIVLDSGNCFTTKANTKISLTPGVHLKYGSHFKAIPTGCPTFPADCQCYTSPNDKTANGFYPHLNKNATILVYPNPANDRLNIVSMNDDDIKSFEIFNINGACIYSKKEEFSKNNVINMEGFANGIYIVKILTDKEVITKRIIKEE